MNPYYHNTQNQGQQNLIQGSSQSDSVLDKRYTSFYIVLLEVLMAFSILAAIIYIWDLSMNPNHKNMFIFIGTSIWSFVQCLLEFLAIRQRSLVKAAIAVTLMTLYTIPSVGYVVYFIQEYLEVIKYPDNGAELAMAVVIVFSVAFLLHAVTLVCAYKVCKRLNERHSRESLV